MRSHVARTLFGNAEIWLWQAAVSYVGRVGPEWGDELRCHELARAVHRMLVLVAKDRRWDAEGLRVCDGKLGMQEHSWIVIQMDTDGQLTGAGIPGLPARTALLDVYAPGRIPQVQLIDNSPLLRLGYKIEGLRKDIDLVAVSKLFDEMGRPE